MHFFFFFVGGGGGPACFVCSCGRGECSVTCVLFTYSTGAAGSVDSPVMRGTPSRPSVADIQMPTVMKLVDENMHWNDSALEVSSLIITNCKVVSSWFLEHNSHKTHRTDYLNAVHFR